MPTKKIRDFPFKEEVPCMSPDHEPPKYRVFSSGEYEHTCSACGKKTIFLVSGPYYRDPPKLPKWTMQGEKKPVSRLFA